MGNVCCALFGRHPACPGCDGQPPFCPEVCACSGGHAEMLCVGESSGSLQKGEISNNKHILCGSVVSCLFA